MPQEELQIPQNVLDTPANAEGEGFVAFGDVWSLSMAGDDGLLYTRKSGVITVEAEDED